MVILIGNICILKNGIKYQFNECYQVGKYLKEQLIAEESLNAY